MFPGERIPVKMGISFMEWSQLLQKTPSPYLYFLGHCCEFWQEGLFPSNPQGKCLFPLFRVIFGVGVLEASVFSDSVPSCQGNRKKSQLIFFIPLSKHLLKHILITPQAFADLPIHSPINTYFLSVHSAQGTAVGPGDMTANRTEELPLRQLTFYGR